MLRRLTTRGRSIRSPLKPVTLLCSRQERRQKMYERRLSNSLDYLKRALIDLQAQEHCRGEAQALERLYAGERRWEDLSMLTQEFVDEWRQSALATMPIGFNDRRYSPFRPFGPTPFQLLAELVAHVPDEA